MKSIKYIVILLVVTSFFSCKNDDDDNPPFLFNIENLEGTYQVTFLEIVEIETTNINGLDVVSTITSVGSVFDLTFQFNSDGSFISDGEFVNSETVQVNGITTIEDQEIVVIDNEASNYTIVTNPPTILLDGDPYEVTLFDENELHIVLEEVSSSNGETFSSRSEIRLSKV